MPKATINDVIQEAIAKDQPPQPTFTEETTTTATITPDLKDKLAESRDKMRQATKAYVMGGVLDGLREISQGDYGDILPQLNEAVEIFATNVTAPKLPSSVAQSQSPLFVLPEAHNG